MTDSKQSQPADEGRGFSEQLGAGSEARYADLPMVERPGRDWTAAELAAFPLWARVCYAVRPFNSGCRTFGDWMRIFGGTDEWICDCGLEREGAGSLVLRLLDAVGA